MKTLAFDEASKNVILQLFGKAIDQQGFIFDIKTGVRVLNPEGDEVLARDFAGIRKGSEIFITRDLPSLIQFASDTED
ncbi:MAG: hypothetical protein WAO28_01625 [Candidatus Microsaccharimonas sp.]